MTGRVDSDAPRLIGLAQAGDHAAIVALLAAVQPDIRRYARRACRVDDVEDAVQEALLLLSRRIGGLRAPAALAGWLFVVVARECRRLGRRGLRVWAPIEEVEDLPGLADRGEPELRLDLAMAIQSLPSPYRRLVLRRDVEEMTIGEIAAAEGLTREAVKGRLRRARSLLREYLLA